MKFTFRMVKIPRYFRDNLRRAVRAPPRQNSFLAESVAMPFSNGQWSHAQKTIVTKGSEQYAMIRAFLRSQFQLIDTGGFRDGEKSRD